MAKRHGDQDRMFRYLLGAMAEEERKSLEESYFVDDNLFEELLAAEDRLIDDYLRGRLSRKDREQFENHFMVSTERRERVEEARTRLKLQGVMASDTSPPPAGRSKRSWPGPRLLFRAAGGRAVRFWTLMTMSALALIALWLLIENIARPPGTVPQQVVSFDLISMALRGSPGIQVLDLRPETKQVKLNVYFDVWDYETYCAKLQTEAGVEIWGEQALTARAMESMKLITVTAPSDLFSSGTYILTLFGEAQNNNYDALGEYKFKVIER